MWKWQKYGKRNSCHTASISQILSAVRIWKRKNGPESKLSSKLKKPRLQVRKLLRAGLASFLTSARAHRQGCQAHNVHEYPRELPPDTQSPGSQNCRAEGSKCQLLFLTNTTLGARVFKTSNQVQFLRTQGAFCASSFGNKQTNREMSRR